MIQLALLGAGGKMGCRVVDHLHHHPGYRLLPIENADAGLANLAARGFQSVPPATALPAADVVVLALPDRVLGRVAHEVVPQLRPGTLVVTLDPAAACAGELPRPARTSRISSVTPVIPASSSTSRPRPKSTTSSAARTRASRLSARSPKDRRSTTNSANESPATSTRRWTRSHRITVEQMAILEPTMAEVCGIALVSALREAMEEAIRRGVPRAAAEDFMAGHIKVPLGIAFERVRFPFSDGARLIAEYGRQRLLRPDWKQVFEPERVREQVLAITTGRLPPPP
jgi:hypothetical protein